MTNDPGVKDMLSFLIARDTMHQNQWMASIEELEQKQDPIVPSTFPHQLQKNEVAYSFMNFSNGIESAQGRWANGRSMDGKSNFEYITSPELMGQVPALIQAPAYVHDSPIPGQPPPMTNQANFSQPLQ